MAGPKAPEKAIPHGPPASLQPSCKLYILTIMSCAGDSQQQWLETGSWQPKFTKLRIRTGSQFSYTPRPTDPLPLLHINMSLGVPCSVSRVPCSVQYIYLSRAGPGRGGGHTWVGWVGWVVEIIIYKKHQGYTLAGRRRAGGHQLDEALGRPSPARATPHALVLYFLRVREHIWLH